MASPSAPARRPSPWASLSNLQLLEFIGAGALTAEQLGEVVSILRERELAREHAACGVTAPPPLVEARRSSRGLLGWFHKPEPTPQPKAVPPDDLEIDAKAIGRGYFGWLREFTERICQAKGYGSTRDIPVRIRIPSFGVPSAQARLLLEDILQEAGWRLDETQPVLSEPVANLIGTISEGRNAVWQPDNPRFDRHPHFPTMFRGSFLGEELLGDGSPIYWIMIADLGGYTADFAWRPPVGARERDEYGR